MFLKRTDFNVTFTKNCLGYYLRTIKKPVSGLWKSASVHLIKIQGYSLNQTFRRLQLLETPKRRALG